MVAFGQLTSCRLANHVYFEILEFEAAVPDVIEDAETEDSHKYCFHGVFLCCFLETGAEKDQNGR